MLLHVTGSKLHAYRFVQTKNYVNFSRQWLYQRGIAYKYRGYSDIRRRFALTLRVTSNQAPAGKHVASGDERVIRGRGRRKAGEY